MSTIKKIILTFIFIILIIVIIKIKFPKSLENKSEIKNKTQLDLNKENTKLHQLELPSSEELTRQAEEEVKKDEAKAKTRQEHQENVEKEKKEEKTQQKFLSVEEIKKEREEYYIKDKEESKKQKQLKRNADKSELLNQYQKHNPNNTITIKDIILYDDVVYDFCIEEYDQNNKLIRKTTYNPDKTLHKIEEYYPLYLDGSRKIIQYINNVVNNIDEIDTNGILHKITRYKNNVVISILEFDSKGNLIYNKNQFTNLPNLFLFQKN